MNIIIALFIYVDYASCKSHEEMQVSVDYSLSITVDISIITL